MKLHTNLPRMWRPLLALLLLGLPGPRTAAGQHTLPWELPKGVPAPRVPSDSPMTPERVELGRHLFYDRRLSGNGIQSCATCHRQELAFTDGRALAVGSTGETHPRSAMSLINEEVLDHYVAGGRAPNPRQSKSIEPLKLSEADRRNLIAFLESLTDRQALQDPRWSNPWTERGQGPRTRAFALPGEFESTDALLNWSNLQVRVTP